MDLCQLFNKAVFFIYKSVAMNYRHLTIKVQVGNAAGFIQMDCFAARLTGAWVLLCFILPEAVKCIKRFR